MKKWLEIKHSKPLKGFIKVPGSKNSVLGLLAACCLGEGAVYLDNVPDIQDVKIALDICHDIGVRYKRQKGKMLLDPSTISSASIDPKKALDFRAAYYFIGAKFTFYNDDYIIIF